MNTRTPAEVADAMRREPLTDPGIVNLFSDTQTRPTPGMRQAIADALVGDEQNDADPTTIALQERVADLLGHESGLFLPSGTMANEIAIRLHLGAGGEELLAAAGSHVLTHEAGGPALLSGAMTTALTGPSQHPWRFGPAEVEAAFQPASNRYAASTRLLCLEQTAGHVGGRVWPVDAIKELLATARRLGLATHLDGARLFNAAAALGVGAAEISGGFDTAWVDLSKGLGAPVGAVLVGSSDLIRRAWRYKQMWGGALRQSGMLAAAGWYALDHHLDRLADDHANATRLAAGLAGLPGVELDASGVESNMVMFDVPDAAAFVDGLGRRGVLMGAMGKQLVRAVTHLDVDADGIDAAIEAATEVLRAG